MENNVKEQVVGQSRAGRQIFSENGKDEGKS